MTFDDPSEKTPAVDFDGGFYNPDQPVSVTLYHVPHWHQVGVFSFITWRLIDSMPAGMLESVKAARKGWMRSHPLPWTAEDAREYTRLFTRRVEDQLDAGFGACFLREARFSSIVEEALRFFDGDRYELDTFVVMPNHVHALILLGDETRLPKIAHSWKSYSAKVIRRETETVGRVWQRGYWDRLMRNGRQLENCRRYIATNPEKARLRPGEFRLYGREAPLHSCEPRLVCRNITRDA